MSLFRVASERMEEYERKEVPLGPVASGPPRLDCHSLSDQSNTPGCLMVSAVGRPSRTS